VRNDRRLDDRWRQRRCRSRMRRCPRPPPMLRPCRWPRPQGSAARQLARLHL